MAMLIGCIPTAWAQDLVYLEHSETLNYDQDRLPDAQILSGNVCFRHDNALMFCDSAYFYEATNSLDAFGHVRFIQGDTLSGYGDVMYYDGNRKFAKLRKHVKLVHRATILTTDSLNYDRISELAWYYTGGQIKDTVSTLTSVWGQYYPPTNQATFRKQVHLFNDDMVLDADTLQYNTGTHVAALVSPTVIVYKDETTILSSNGWYNTATEQSQLLDRSQILHIDGKQMTADTINYNRRTGYGQGLSHFELRDTVQKGTLYGDYGELHEYGDQHYVGEHGYVTRHTLLVDWSNDTSYTYIHADSIFTEVVPDTLMIITQLDSLTQDTTYRDTTHRQLRAYYNVRAYNKDYQAVCDSLLYNDKDSIATLYHLPVCWSDSQQVAADLIVVYLKNKTVDYIHGIDNAIAIKMEDFDMFDQMAGKEMFAYIREGELRQIDVNGNAETVFYPKEEDGSYIGVNRTQSSNIKMYLREQKIDHILFTTSTSGTLYPLDQMPENEKKLRPFFWAEDVRPTDPDDVFRVSKKVVRPSSAAVSAAVEEEEEDKPATQRPARNKKKH
ncbi:MAG: hypothetical protein MJZ82_04400 [Paludibacteraceae bacterium]|nr:hypothetical protein [Paludibacteraceae bacterium]